MRIPAIQGVIRRRILVNYRVDPAAIVQLLPAKFRPKLHRGYAVAGICLIRLEHIRAMHVPKLLGLNSENAAHRIAVEWTDEGGTPRDGVFIPRRDTSSVLNRWLGGRFFPGEHHRAEFTIREAPPEVDLTMRSHDGAAAIKVAGRLGDSIPSSSIFDSLASSSAFFQRGSLGYSPTRNPCCLDGVILDVEGWHVQPFDVSEVYSSYFSDERVFPRGSVRFDHALIMRDISHRWRSVDGLHI
jgi:hypothetical protein